MRVLVVEDEIKMAGLLRRGLAEDGMAVDVAGSGEDALVRATATQYDAIVFVEHVTPTHTTPNALRAFARRERY